MKTAADTAAMIHEVLTVGAMMLVACVAVWGAMVVAASMMEAKTKTKARHPA
jgi:hypothetical protein